MPSQSGKERNCDVTVRLLSGSPTHFSSQAGSTRKYHPSWKACASRLCLARRQTGKRHRGPKTAQKKHIFRDIQHSIAGRHKFDRVMWVSLSGNKEKKSLMGKMTNLIFFATYLSPPMIQRWSRNPLDRPTLFVRHYFVHTCQSRGRRWFSQWLLLLCFY